jgi:hypothetical protein
MKSSNSALVPALAFLSTCSRPEFENNLCIYLLCTFQSLWRSVGLVLQDGTRVNTAAIPAQPNDSDLAYYGHHPNLKWAYSLSAKTIHHGPAQRRSLQRRQPARWIINMRSKPLVGPATLLRWRHAARRIMPATRQARAHAQWHGNNTRLTRLGCTPRRPLYPQHHSLSPPGQPNNAQCLLLQRRQPARQRPPTGAEPARGRLASAARLIGPYWK